MRTALLTTTLLAATTLVGVAGASAAPSDAGATARFTGTVGETVDPAADTGVPRRWMRHVGDPAPEGYGHGYQWGTPSITTPGDAGTVTLDGTLDLVDAVKGEFGLIGLLDTATLAADERGLNEGSYMYVTMKNADTVVLGLSDGRAAGGEYVQRFHTIDLTGTDRVLDVTFTVDPAADPSGCATSEDDVYTAEGCLTLAVDDLPLLRDSYGTITNDEANGGDELRDGATAGWDGLASAEDATGIHYDLTVSPADGPRTKADCKDGGWGTYAFSNQGRCIKAVVAP